MKIIKVTALMALACFALAGEVSAQVCGDADGNGSLNILDVAITANYICGLPDPINLANADCDGVPGVTISDLAAIIGYVYARLPVDCNLSGSYSFANANSDTIYVPRILNVPAEVDQVDLLVFGTFSSLTDGMYMPIKELGIGSSSNFDLDRVIPVNYGVGGGVVTNPNERVLFLNDNYTDPPGFMNGNQNLMMLSYQRISPGIATIIPEPFDRPSPWNIAITRNDDLLFPVVAYYDVTSPSGGLEISDHDFAFHALVNAPSLDTFRVDISQGPYGVAFELSSSVPWVTASQYNGVTPATVTFLANASGMGVFEYSGVIRVSYGGIWTPVDSMNVSLTVHPAGNPTFPAGDTNCDGALNILDLTNLVDFFFRGGLRPFPCEK